MIKVENVSFWYSEDVKALDRINIEFPRGQISSVLGESGAGKTTLLMALGQFLQPTDGQVTFDGTDIYEIPEREFRQKVGIVFQRLFLFPHLTVLENMTLAPRHVLGQTRRAARKEARAVLDRLGVGELAKSYPSQISGGQAQRAAIARGLLLKPEYMLLDEPTSALDANTTDDFANWLRSLRTETNFIIVTHDLLFARQASDHGVYLSDGTIRREGTIEQIIDTIREGRDTEVLK